MSFLDRVFSPRPRSPAPLPPRRPSASVAVTPVRRELIQMAYRDTVRRHGIPENWVGIETLSSTSAGRSSGVHARLLVKVWHPELMVYLPQITKLIQNRLLKFDRTSASWLSGFSLRYDFPTDVELDDLPASPSWSAREPSSADDDQSSDAASTRSPARDWLDRLLSPGDASSRERENDFRPTQPMFKR